MKTLRERTRRRARRWIASHPFPWRRSLLLEQHLLPTRRLAAFADFLVPKPGEDPYDVFPIAPGIELALDMRSFAQRAIAYRLSDENELALVRSLLHAGDIVVDVGANVGLYALVASGLVCPTGIVHAFEPNPATSRQLRHNVNLNGAVNVVVHEAALSATGGRATLRTPDPHEPGLATLVGAGEPIVDVLVMSLDDFAACERIDRVALLKIDVEGSESNVLRGASRLLAQRRVEKILFEVLDGATEPQRILARYGFYMRVVTPVGSPTLTRPCGVEERFRYANILASR